MALKEESSKKDISLNTLVMQILRKSIQFDMRMNALPNITLSQPLFLKILEKLDLSQKEEVAKQGLQMVKNLFAILGIEYNVQNIIDEYFTILGRYCGWYTFHYTRDENCYRLVFETEYGSEWIEFLRLYLLTILNSLKICVNNKSIADSVMIFEFQV